MAPYRVLVVDDSAFMRKIISDLIVKDSQFTIVATAVNGKEAVAAAAKWRPDAITLDLEMPVMNGFEALKLIMNKNPTPIIMLSGISEEHTRQTIKALQYGAFDFIHKPTDAINHDINQVGDQLLEKLRIAVLMKRHQPILDIKRHENSLKSAAATEIMIKRSIPPPVIEKMPVVTPLHKELDEPSAKTANPQKQLQLQKHKQQSPDNNQTAKREELSATIKSEIKTPKIKQANGEKGISSFTHIVAMGTSTGGPRALHKVISSLPADFKAPVLVVQHMPPKFTKSLAQRLDNFSPLQVVEAGQEMRVLSGNVYIAPGGYHMELMKDHSGYFIRLTEQPLRNGHRPSVDVLFESLLPYNELKRHAVLMTGMGSDGAKGMKLLNESGAESTIAESEDTCVVYGMPRAAVEVGGVRTVLPLQSIASQLVNVTQK